MRISRSRVVIAGLAVVAVAAIAIAAAQGPWRQRTVFTGADVEILERDLQSVEEFESLGYRGRPGMPPWPATLPLDWSADPFRDDNWQTRLQSWHLIDPYFRRYRQQGDPADLAKAAAYAVDWSRYHYLEARESPYSWFDMAVGFRAMKLAFLLDRIASGELAIPEDERALLARAASDHVRRLREESFVALNNHGLFQILGLRMLCALPKMDGCKHARIFADWMLLKIIGLSYTGQGVHKEHSPTYAFLVTDWLAEPSFMRWWPKIVGPVVDKALPLEPWYVFPDSSLATVGDTWGKSDPLLAENVSGADTQCLGKRCFAVKDLTASGFAIIRSLPDVAPERQSMLFVTGAAWSLAHKHVDDLSFILFERGRYIFVDAGSPGYTRDLRRRYVLGASAHNTISLADFHIEPKHVQVGKTTLDPIAVTEAGFVISGSVDRNSIFQQRRTLTYAPRKSLTVRDELSGRHTRQYVSSLHLAPDLEPVVKATGFSVDLGAGRRIEARVEEPDCVVSAARGQEDPLLGWVAVDGELVPTSVVRAVCPGAARTITWRIDLADLPPP